MLEPPFVPIILTPDFSTSSWPPPYHKFVADLLTQVATELSLMQ